MPAARGIDNLNSLRTALEQGRDQIGQVSPDRFEARRFVDTSMPRTGKSYTAAGGFLHDLGGFDADYFGISPKEASRMDPQHRLLLEPAVEARDDAGIAYGRLAGSDTAVYVGVSDTSYGGLQREVVQPVLLDEQSGRRLRRDRSSATLWCP
ncbi:beta-ketoacyl synthase N-terminal-like domain-containing protein [Streptomyces triculaminicus]|uniref:beta-ketoacyl synthase N-terminal-like domain-containing protein n=1 Tax=Streptomyces triculaminicus TaxID=2816232 RepID=UPI0037D51CD4